MIWYLTSPYKEFGELENIETKKEVAMEGLGNVNDDLPDYPAQPCRICGCGDYWLREAWGITEWLCTRCHPKPEEAMHNVRRDVFEAIGEVDILFSRP